MMKSYEVSLLSLVLIQFFSATYSAYIFGYMLRNPVPSDQATMDSDSLDHELATLELPQNDGSNNLTTNATRIRCTTNEDCHRSDEQMYCDSHYGYCDVLHAEMELCRRDEQCDKGLICMFGKCQKEPKAGQKGSRCKSDDDCKPHHCCARQHGEKICKPKLQKSQRCYVPTGGLDYSLNELCPCDSGLVCSKKKKKINNNERKERQSLRTTMDQLRCLRA